MHANVEEKVDHAIRHVEDLYRSVTGETAPPRTEDGAIPPEREPAQYVEEQMERLASALGTLSSTELVWARGELSAPISVWEDDDRYLVYVDLPGVPRDRVHVSIRGEHVEIIAQRVDLLDRSSSARLHWAERAGRRFRRLVPLPRGAQAHEIRAEMRDGVLELRIPRAPYARVIPIS